jgi:hypothetical protein
MRRSRASAIHAVGDRCLSSCRTIIHVGLNGAKSWHMPDTAVSGWSHPDVTAERVYLRTPAFAVTPGHLLRVAVVASPSGMTTMPDGIGGYMSGGPKGEIKISVAFDNGSSTPTITKTITLPNSQLANGAQPTGAGAAWSSLITRETGPIWPDDLTDPQTLADWTEGVTATITVSLVGSPRVIDLTIYEEPNALCYDLSSGDWIAPMHADGGGGQLPALLGKVPRIKQSGSHPGGGAEIVVDAAARLAQEIGPVIMFHSAWDEDSQSVASTETDPKTIAAVSPNYTELISGVTTAAGATRPGWSTSSGANALRIQDSGPRVLRDKTGVVPVRCYIYGAMSTAVGSPTAIVRFQTDANEYIQVAIPAGTSYAWRSSPGFLRCGLGAQDPHAIQVSAIVSAQTFNWRYLMVVYDGTL